MVVQQPISILYLSLQDIMKLGFSFDEAIATVEASLREHGEKQVENPPKLPIHPKPDAFINAMPAFLPRKQASGMKWIAGFPSNTPKHLPTIAGLLILNDPETGMPLAVMDSTYITMLRTVAVSAVATKFLSNPDSECLGIVGCGVQGKNHALVVKRLVPGLRRMQILDLYPPAIESFLAEIQPRLEDVELVVMESAEEVIRGADIVITATGKLLEPIFHHSWVKKGALVLPVHTQGWDSETPSRMDKLVVDDWAQFRTVADIIYQPVPERPHAETGEIVAGLRPGRESQSETIVNFNKGMAIHDVLMADAMYKKARTAGIGLELEFLDPGQEMPLIDW